MSRPITIEDDVAYVTLTKGFVAVIDAADVPLIDGRNWSALVSPRRKAVYAARVVQENGRQRMLLMHRVLASPPADMTADHKDGDGLNNRRSNLRVCTRAENNLNTGLRADNSSGFKGVVLDKRVNRWRAEIMRDGRSVYLGMYASPAEAHAAYVAASKELHGEFGRVA